MNTCERQRCWRDAALDTTPKRTSFCREVFTENQKRYTRWPGRAGSAWAPTGQSTASGRGTTCNSSAWSCSTSAASTPHSCPGLRGLPRPACGARSHCGSAETCTALGLRLGFDERIDALEECTPNMFIAVVDAILKVQVPGVDRDPATVEAHESNMQALLDFLAEVIGTDLSHINHQSICQGKTDDISNALDIVMRLADIVQGPEGFGEEQTGSGDASKAGNRRARVVSEEVIIEEKSEDDSSEDSNGMMMNTPRFGRHLARRARQRRAAPREGDMTMDRLIRQQVRDTMAQLAARHGMLGAAISGDETAPKVVFKPLSDDGKYRNAATVNVKAKPRVTAGLRVPGYLRPTESALAAARKVDNLTTWGTGWPPSPRLARSRPDTGPPLPNPWRPLPLPHTKLQTSDAAAGADVDDDGWVVVEGAEMPGAAITAAAKRKRAVMRSALHRVRRENHQRRQLEQELQRLHEGAWLDASHEIMQAVRNRVAYSLRQQRQALVLEQACSKAQERSQAARLLARKAALETFAQDQAEMAQTAVRIRTYQVMTSDKAAAQRCAELERERHAMGRQRMLRAMEQMRAGYSHQTYLARSSLST